MAKTKILSPVKCPGSEEALMEWIIQQFPEEYKVYLEPYTGTAVILLNKESVEEEAINHTDYAVACIYRAIRDEASEFVSRLRKIDYSEETFKKYIDNSEHQDYLDIAINEYALRKMSWSGLKVTFNQSKDRWEQNIKSIPLIAERLRKVFILNEKEVIDLLKLFDSEDTLIYCNTNHIPKETHFQFSDVVHSTKSKVVISGNYSLICQKYYNEWWHQTTKMPHSNKLYGLWKNF